jgi:predicted dienelactone hydrolase
MRKSRWGRLAAWIAALAVAAPAGAAERIVFRIGEIERSVKVADLAAFARTGGLTPDLSAYLGRLSPADRQAFRTALTQTAPLDDVAVSTFLETPLGQASLEQLAKVLVQPPAITEPALASALLLGPAKAGRLRLLDVVQAYPLPSITVNVPAVTALVRELSQQFNLQNRLYPKLAALDGGAATPDAVSAAALAALAQPGSQPYRSEPFTFQAPGQQNVTALALLPQGSAKVPLVVLAPGLNTDFNALLYLGRHLASHGYAVAALDFPFSSANEVQAALNGLAVIPAPNAWFGQPQTVSALIDAVQQRWGRAVDTGNVGVLGQSLGGYTVLALGGARLDWPGLQQACQALADPTQVVLNPAVLWQCQAPNQVVATQTMADGRVRAVVALNPVASPIFSAASMQQVQVPLLMLAGTNDIFAPPVSQQLWPFTAVQQPDRVLGLLDHGTHISFLNGTARLPGFITGPDRSVAQDELRSLGLAFFNTHLRGDSVMKQLVPATGGVVVGRQPLPLLLRRQLDAQQLEQVAPGSNELL